MLKSNPTPDNTKAKMKTKKWRKKLAELNDDMLCLDQLYENVIADFIQSLLDSQRAELLEIVIEDVPHKYQTRLLDLLSKEEK